MKAEFDIPPSEMDRLIEGVPEVSNRQISSILISSPRPMIMTDDNSGTDLHWAARDGDERTTKMLIKENASLIYKVDYRSETPLHVAAERGHKKIVKMIVKADRLLILKQNDKGQTAVHLASKEGHKEVIEILLAPLASANFLTSIKNFLFGCLYLATFCCCCDCCDCNEELDDDTPLGKIWGYRCYNVTRGSISNLINKEDNDGCSALDLAAVNGYDKVLKILLGNYFHSGNVNTRQKVKALNLAAFYEQEKTAKVLIAKICNESGASFAVGEAARYGYEYAAKMLIAKEPELFTDYNADGWPYLHTAAKNGHEKMVELLIAKNPMLTNRGSAIGSALRLAAENGHVEVVQVLIAKIPELLKLCGKDGCTALYEASKNNHKNVVTMLQDKIPFDVVIKELSDLDKTDYLREFSELLHSYLKDYMANDVIDIIYKYNIQSDNSIVELIGQEIQDEG